MPRRTAIWMAALFSAALAMSSPGCGKATKKPIPSDSSSRKISGDLIVFHAGSLSVPLRQVSEAFMARNRAVTVLAEAAGSRDAARKVSDLRRPCDVLASADYKVVEELLMPEDAKFNIRFATNELAIVYTDRSARAAEIDANNWPGILLSESVRFGRADPNRDPCGYRTVMLMQLAQKHYKQPGLAGRLEQKDGRRFIRPKETDLLALLEIGEIDYLFIYRSVGLQHHLKVLSLPDEVNLRNPAMEDLYREAEVQITGKRPGQTVRLKGEAIVYSVTIPVNSPNRAAAEAYVEFLLSPEGRKILADNGQGLIVPAIADGLNGLPPGIGKYCIGK